MRADEMQKRMGRSLPFIGERITLCPGCTCRKSAYDYCLECTKRIRKSEKQYTQEHARDANTWGEWEKRLARGYWGKAA